MRTGSVRLSLALPPRLRRGLREARRRPDAHARVGGARGGLRRPAPHRGERRRHRLDAPADSHPRRRAVARAAGAGADAVGFAQRHRRHRHRHRHPRQPGRRRHRRHAPGALAVGERDGLRRLARAGARRRRLRPLGEEPRRPDGGAGARPRRGAAAGAHRRPGPLHLRRPEGPDPHPHRHRLPRHRHGKAAGHHHLQRQDADQDLRPHRALGLRGHRHLGAERPRAVHRRHLRGAPAGPRAGLNLMIVEMSFIAN